jgi:tetratricopeptide (TPR) repeat protein
MTRSNEDPDPQSVRQTAKASGGARIYQAGRDVNINVVETAAAVVASRTLPMDRETFTGRTAELDWLSAAVHRWAAGGRNVVTILALDGMAGVGKSALAVHAAHRWASRFPDGQLFMRLHAHTPGQRPVTAVDALGSLLLAIGVSMGDIPTGLDDRARLWRDRVTNKRILLLLDDAASEEQVRPLLPASPSCLVLVTSRHRMAALVEAEPLTLEALPPDDATVLFTWLVPATSTQSQAVAHLVERCGYLPLAIELLAGRLRHHPAWSVTDLVGLLDVTEGWLEEIRAGRSTVTAAFELSYRDLPPEQQRLFRMLALHPGPDIDAYAAAAIGALPLVQARELLEALYDDHLIQEPARGRYHMHDLVRAYAGALVGQYPAAERQEHTDQLMNYYLYTAQRAERQLWPSTLPKSEPAILVTWHDTPRFENPEQAGAWIALELPNLIVWIDYARAHRPAYLIAMSSALAQYLQARGPWTQGLVLHQEAWETARRIGDRHGQAAAVYALGVIQKLTGAYARAEDSLAQAVDVYRDLREFTGQATALSELGAVHWSTGAYPQAKRSLNEALEIYRALDDGLGQAGVLAELGLVHELMGEFTDAHESLTQALAGRRELGDLHSQASTLRYLGTVQRLIGAYGPAKESLTEALEIHHAEASPYNQAAALMELGAVERLTGAYAQAEDNLTRAWELFHSLDDPRGQACVLTELGALHRSTGAYAKAQDNLTRALKAFRDLNDPGGEVEALIHYGALIAITGTPAQARVQFVDALRLARRIKSRCDEANALNGIAHTYRAQGDTTRAQTHFRQALDQYRSMGCLADITHVQAALDSIQRPRPFGNGAQDTSLQ